MDCFIRNAVRAIIIRDGQILLCEYHDDDGYFYVTPGGGQEYGETMKNALSRECLEELGTEVKIGEIVYVRDAIFRYKDELGIYFDNHHQIECFFKCELPEGAEVIMGNVPDNGQTGIKWIPIAALKLIRVYPAPFADLIKEDGTLSGEVYLETTD